MINSVKTQKIVDVIIDPTHMLYKVILIHLCVFSFKMKLQIGEHRMCISSINYIWHTHSSNEHHYMAP